jgi:exodeoxyribonuclease VII large subunit
MATAAPSHNQPEYTVSEISSALKRVVEDNFGYVRIRGEISGWRGPHSSGHAYFRLKDDKSVIEAVCWRGTLGRLGCKLEEGLEVIATGRVTTYPGKSNYQLVVEAMEPAGTGALLALLEKRKKQLEAEGLFDPSRKKPLPFLPRVIGVVTSPTGAVIRDILHRLADRYPVHVLVWPVAVQGEAAAAQIAAAISGFNTLPANGPIPRPELLIIARGGGSIEDLWAFNEEIVVRAAAGSRIPLISAVGHETDTTLIDFVSDRRAPTPTAAAEMAVPVRADLWLAVNEMGTRLGSASLRYLRQREQMLAGLVRGLPSPARLLEHASQRLDDWSERLHQSLPNLLRSRAQALQMAASRLRPQPMLQDIVRHDRRVEELWQRATRAAQRRIADHERHLASLAQMLSSLDHMRVLARGYALVKNADGHLITTARKAAEEKKLTILFKDGEVDIDA